MKPFFYTIATIIFTVFITPFAFAETVDTGGNTGAFSCPFSRGGFGVMMNGGYGMGFGNGYWGYSLIGLFLHIIFWIALVAVTVYIARKVWDASGSNKKQ